MIRVVLDTNVVVSAYLNPDGLPFFILKLGLAGTVSLCASEDILAEYDELFRRKSFPLDRRRSRVLLSQIRKASEMFTPAGSLRIAKDPDDNIFLECALAAKARYLITGNAEDFPPKRWKYTEIVTPRMFINKWKDFRPGE